jgi:hypothetical protein
MKMRTTTAGTGLGARLTAAGWATVTILASASVAACAGSTPSATLPKFSPGATASASPTISLSRTAAVTTPSARTSASASPSATPSARTSHSASPSATPRSSASSFPAAAPATGGGGTAGFQDVPLFGLGGAAILAGAGCVAYRRKVIRNRRDT